MKKLVLAVIAMVVVGMTSCKKEEGATPEFKKASVSMSEKKDTSTWD